MTKSEVNKLLNKIKGYYNSQFFLDEYVISAWIEEMEPYDFEDAEQHFKEYLKEYPDMAPKPHTFKKGLLTREEKEKRKNAKYTVQCNLCQNWMTLQEYEEHYGRCLDIQYLVGVIKQKNLDITREELEGKSDEIIEGLLNKYPPKKITLDEVKKIIS